eukprot:9002605-Alexandrium_andersonii.AAC.1
MAVEERHPDAKDPQALLAALEVAKPMDKGLFMKQAYGRDAWHYPDLRSPAKKDLPLDGVYKFDVKLLESLGETLRWGSLFEAIRQLA